MAEHPKMIMLFLDVYRTLGILRLPDRSILYRNPQNLEYSLTIDITKCFQGPSVGKRRLSKTFSVRGSSTGILRPSVCFAPFLTSAYLGCNDLYRAVMGWVEPK